MIYKVTQRWQGRWREELIELPAGSLVIEQETTSLSGIDTTGFRVFTLEADLASFINRDAPGTLVEYQPAPETRELVEPPADRQLSKAPRSRQRKKAKKADDA